MQTALIVDDDPKNRKIVNAYLTKDNFNVFEADNANEAFQLLEKLVPDVILMDFQMPGLNGLETIEKIRKTNIFTCIIMMTAYASQEIVIGAIRSQADDFLSKPLSFKELGNICRSAIIKRREIYPIDAYELNENETIFSALMVSRNNDSLYVRDPINNEVLKVFNLGSFNELYSEITKFITQLSSSIITNSDGIIIQELRISKFYVFYYYCPDFIVFAFLTENQYNLLIEFEVIEVLESILKEIVEIVKSSDQSDLIRDQIDHLLSVILEDFSFSENE
jgi:DNA-binding response OmpR family regulator